MEERDFLAMTFQEAIRFAHASTVVSSQDHSSYAGPDIHVWYDNGLLVRYGVDNQPTSVQLCGTYLTLYE